MLVAENEEKEMEKERVVNESVPPLKLSGLSVQELQVLQRKIRSHASLLDILLTVFFSFFQDLCKELHQKLDVVDELRYDMQAKVNKNENEVQKI